jgi:hypothetical protein
VKIYVNCSLESNFRHREELLRIPAHREHPFRSIVSSDSGRT